ncbi:MAG TPA: hypothetical protein PKO06_08585 [Candidatus Ozemobacteraceae bacterium]|nr:hypothetical protein [Candidatus Ozemobacteraceae bacterium]
MPEGSNRERDLVLAPNEFAFISDQTKGNINVYVGSYKTSLANTDQPVTFNYQSKRFERCTLEQAIQLFAIAPEGWYLVMKNPAKDNVHPKNSTVNNLCELEIGKKVNAPGPISFALWPGQMVKIIQGHHLRSNQYLVVRVYDEEAAKKNWQKAVMKPQNPGSPEEAGKDIAAEDLTMGKQLVIKGTEVSFYIPPTGIEVVPSDDGIFVREAVTLERLEYCILLDENGNKRYIKGPDVVFPNPTETFVEKHGSRKFKAIELNEISGLYIKVIAPYSEGGKEYKVGDELFLTGKDTMIYFPRPEHAIIKYGDQEIHYAVAIPAGEGRYVLNRLTGKIQLHKGPAMLLPDPRNEVVVRRVLDPKVCELWFPGNTEALEYNRSLKQMSTGKAQEPYVADGEVRRLHAAAPAPLAKKAESAAEGFAGDDFHRRANFTQPRTITLDTKYEGAVSISVWTGYAVLVVNKAGERKVVAGPQTYLLEYDESLEALELSTGTPKSSDKTLKTSYLRILHNKISDVVEAETADLVRVRILVSYRVNFEGEEGRWFNVENYVKFLTDHMRSLISNRIKEMTIESFYARAINLVRDMVLGVTGPDGKRSGRIFKENGMVIYDVEVLDVKIGDTGIEKLLVEAQHSVVQQNLEVSAQKRQLEYVRQTETVKQQVAQAKATTKTLEIDIQTEEVKRQLMLNLAKIESEVEGRKLALEAKFNDQELLTKVETAELARRKAAADLELAVAHRRLEQQLESLRAEVKAVVDKAEAVSPELIAALQAFSDRALAERMAESMAPLAILGGKSIAEVFATLLQGTPIEAVLKRKAVSAPVSTPTPPATK